MSHQILKLLKILRALHALGRLSQPLKRKGYFLGPVYALKVPPVQTKEEKDLSGSHFMTGQWRRLAWAFGAVAPNIFSLAPNNSPL